MVPRATLRAYEPLDAFARPERERWAALVASGRALSRSEAVRREDETSVARLLTGRGPFAPGTALVRRAGNVVHICPLQLELRVANGLRALRAMMPDEVLHELLPDWEVRSQLDEVAATDAPAHVLDAAWSVPLPWFLAFQPDDRHVVDHPEGRGTRLVYVTRAELANRRLRRALAVVEATIEDGEDILAAVAGVDAWIDAFHPDTLIELDYGSVASQFSREELEADFSCGDLWDAIGALSSGDVLGAVARHTQVRQRWDRTLSLQRRN
ncbi:MAG: hypothetical protein R3249_08855 [Nitriliruptorales bacterium]|nr:hypothetical protein [Nitriliruptorales bacterium]